MSYARSWRKEYRRYQPIGVTIVASNSRSRTSHLILAPRLSETVPARLACSAHSSLRLVPHKTRRPLCSACALLLRKWWPEFPIGEHVLPPTPDRPYAFPP